MHGSLRGIDMTEQFVENALVIAPPQEATYRLQENDPFVDLQSDLSTLRALEGHKVCMNSGIVIGVLVGFKDSCVPLVHYTGNESGEPSPARTTMTLGRSEVGRQVVLMFEDGNPKKPIVLGLIQDSDKEWFNEVGNVRPEKQTPVQVEIDGERLVLTAEKEIILRCGEASITLTQAGKVLIRGTYLLSRSSGVNRIKGGSVQIN